MQDHIVAGSVWRALALTALAWLSMLGVDFLLHGGLLAALYLQSSPFLVSPATAFALIPVGYLALLLFAMLLVWLMTRQQVAGWRPGALFGLAVGALTAGAFVLGLFSISTASMSLLAGWFAGQTAELAIAGAVVGSGLAGVRLRRLVAVVVGLVVLCVITTLLLQSVGLAPAIHISA
jgi:hypothetical protein